MKLVNLMAGEVLPVKRQMPETPSADPRDLPCVRFNAVQVEEIVVDDYSLMLFHATRVEPLSLQDIEKKFPEPSPGRAKRVISRFCDVGLLDVKMPGSLFYTKFPGNFPNFTDHEYDAPNEAMKDKRVFALMKKNAGDREYWKTQSYFSTDGFFSDTQAMEIKKMLHDIKFYIKACLNENAKNKSLEGLTFRRHKFYDLVLSLAFVMLLTVTSVKSFASNDPGSAAGVQQARLIAPFSDKALTGAMNLSSRKLLRQFSSNDPGSSVNRSGGGDQVQFNANESEASVILASMVTESSQAAWSKEMFADWLDWNAKSCQAEIRQNNKDLTQVSPSCFATAKRAIGDVCTGFNDEAFCEFSIQLEAYKPSR